MSQNTTTGQALPLGEAAAQFAAMPIGEMPIDQLLAMLDTAAASIDQIGPVFHKICQRLGSAEVGFDDRVIEHVRAAARCATGMHNQATESAAMARVLYEAYVTAAETGGTVLNRDVLVNTQNSGI